ncbi:MAG: PASTA domain-containing protein [Actinomycetes bacterium]
MSDTPLPTLPERIGGRYHPQARIGRGGMAEVWRAHDEVLQRDVALKVLHQHLADDPAFEDRFRREARAAAALSHPNVVAVFDWGEGPDGTFLVMELVPGASVRDVLRVRGRLTPAEALTVLGQAAGGVAAAHRAGLVHRDVKPENLLIGADGAVKVTDFGLARAAAASTATFADAVVGSPHYLAPECVRGEPVGPATDVYALGVVLYECLVGAPPFQGDTPMATAVQHTTRGVPAPSLQAPGTPPALDAVVARATHPDPAERFPDAAAFAQALAAAVPEGPAAVDLRDGTYPTVVLAGAARETLVGLGAEVADTTRITGRIAGSTTTTLDPGDDAAGDEAGRGGTSAPRRRWPRRLAWLALVAVLLGAGGWTAWDRVIAPVTDVPSVVGDPVDVARAELEAAGFSVAIAPNREFDRTVPEEHVLRQDPTGSIRRGETVLLTVSAGPRTATLPAVAGREEADALAELEAMPIDVEVTVERRHDDEVAEGLVVSTDPAGGTTVEEGGAVAVVVSLGRPPVDVPDVLGLALEDARASMREAGLELTVADEVHDDDAPAGTVLATSPGPTTEVRRGDTVEAVVSLGPAPVDVPDVRGKTEQEATAELRALGLRVEVVDVETIIPFRAGRVDEQDPGPGTRVRRGDTVRIFVWR